MQEQGGSKEHELLLANAIHIVDKFQLPPASSEKENEEQEQESGCRGELLPMCLLAAVFLLLQVLTNSCSCSWLLAPGTPTFVHAQNIIPCFDFFFKLLLLFLNLQSSFHNTPLKNYICFALS